MPSAISPTESMSPTKAPFVFPAEHPEFVLSSPLEALTPVLPSLGDFMGGSRSSFMDEKNDFDLMRVPSNGSSVYSNLNEYRKSRVVTVGANESALDDIVKFTNVQAERMLSPRGSIGDFQAERTSSSSSMNRREPALRTSNISNNSTHSANSPPRDNIAQRTSPSQPPEAPLPALPGTASSQCAADQRGSFTHRGSFTSAPTSPRSYNAQAQTERTASPPTDFGSSDPFGASSGFEHSVDYQLSHFSLASQSQTQPHQQSGPYSALQERNSTFPVHHPNSDLPSSLRPFSPSVDQQMGTSNSSMKASPSKLLKEPQSLHHTETLEQIGPPSAPLGTMRGEVPRKVSPSAMGNFANLRNKLASRSSEDVPAPKIEEKEKEVERPKTGSRFGKLKSKMRSSNEDESHNIPAPKAPAKEEGSSWSRLKSKVKNGRNGDDDKGGKDKVGRPMLAPISTTHATDSSAAPKLGSPFKDSMSPDFDAPAAPQYQAYRPGTLGPNTQQHRSDTSMSTVRPFTPSEGPGAGLSRTDSEILLPPGASEFAQVHPLYRSESALSTTETLTKLQSLKAPAPQFHPDAQALRQRAGSAPNRPGFGAGPNSGSSSPMVSRNNSGNKSPGAQDGYPFPVVPANDRRPQTGLVKGPKNDYPMLMPKELSSDMAEILKKSPFLSTPAIKRKALPLSASEKPRTDGSGSASGGSSGSNTLIAEDDTIYPALPITLMQLECFQAHRQMRPSRNDVYAVACGICNIEDKGKRWCCAWCSLRCCQECIRKLRSANGGLVGVLNGLRKSDVVEALYAEKASKARESERLVGNLTDIPTFSFDMEKGITNRSPNVPGAFPITPQMGY